MKVKNLLFTVIFILFCLVPVLFMVVSGPSEAGSNEVLAAAPSLTKRDGTVNFGYLSDVSRWFSDRFGLRQELITAQARLTAAVFGESATDDVILGRDGWLYYADTLPDYEGTAPMTERQIWNAAHTLRLMQEYAAAYGADMVFTAAPNKNTLYPEAMPARYPRSTRESNLQRLHAALDAEGVRYCDLLTLLRQQPEPVYYKTDSHWNGLGSAMSCDALLAALGRESALAAEAFTAAPHAGDLSEMLYPAAACTEDGAVLARERTFAYDGAIRGTDDMTIRTTSREGSGSLLMFRDSFGNTLHADMAEAFERACFSRAMPYDLTYLEREQADTLVLEIVERNLVDLAVKPPVMEGLVRDIPVPDKTAFGEASLQVGGAAPEGLTRYTGSVLCPEMDGDSPICLVLDGTVYEATPAGETETAFCLYGPEAERVEVLIRTGGQWAKLIEK